MRIVQKVQNGICRNMEIELGDDWKVRRRGRGRQECGRRVHEADGHSERSYKDSKIGVEVGLLARSL